MINKKMKDETVKEQLSAGAKDKLYHFLLHRGAIRGGIVHSTRMINQMRANHEIGILETVALGHALMGGALIASDLKGNDRIRLEIECSGPIKGLVVEANAFGDVRGFLKQIPIPVEKPLDSFDLSSFFGAGFLSITRFLEDDKAPFTGNVMLQYGNIAQDLAHYFLHSEQVPASFNLSIQFDSGGNVTGAGGLFLQTMPGAGETTVAEIEALIRQLPSLGAVFSDGTDPVQFIRDVFKAHAPEFLASRRIEFLCPCGQDFFRAILAHMPADELADMISTDPFPLELRCQYCNTPYYFSKNDLQHIYERRHHMSEGYVDKSLMTGTPDDI